MSGNTKKNPKAGGTKAAAKPKASGAKGKRSPAIVTLTSLQAKHADKPKMIQPKFLEFGTPSGDTVIIQKIPVGKRDEILDAATKEDGALDMGLYAHHATLASIVSVNGGNPLTFDEIGMMDPDDFEVIYEKVNNLSYRKVGEVVKNFPNG